MIDQFRLEVCKKRIKEAKKIVFFGGAGVSTASGIPDFRSPQGLYNIKSKYGIPYDKEDWKRFEKDALKYKLLNVCCIN